MNPKPTATHHESRESTNGPWKKKIISFPAKHLINYATFQRYSSHFSIGKRARFHSLFFFSEKWFKSAERKLKWRICNNLCKHRGRPYARNKETH